MADQLTYRSGRGRLVLTATIAASGISFLDSTVVNVALPRIGADLGGGFATLQWVLDAYLLTLGSLVLVGGALGDLLGRRRVFIWGIVGFGIASAACGLAPNALALTIARAVQGIAAALLVPGSLAIISATFTGEERGRAIGAWSGLSGVFTAFGPFLGGWLVDTSASGWRWVFLINVPIVAATLVLTRAIPATPGSRRSDDSLVAQLDLGAAVLVAVGLGLIVYPLIEVSRLSGGAMAVMLALGFIALAAFMIVEARGRYPMMPLGLWRIRTFTVANIVTFITYGAFGGAFFLVVVLLQRGLGYSALASGAAGLPVTILLLLLSPRMGGLVIRVGARPLLTIGAVGVGAGFLLMLRIKPGATYWFGVFPGMVVFALGLAFVVTPITTTALRDIPMDRNGIASGVNNATARVGSLIAVAVLPLASGIASTSTSDVANLINGVHRALVIAAAACFVAAAVAWFALPRQSAPTEAKTADVTPAPPSMGPAVEPESRQAQPRGG